MYFEERNSVELKDKKNFDSLFIFGEGIAIGIIIGAILFWKRRKKKKVKRKHSSLVRNLKPKK